MSVRIEQEPEGEHRQGHIWLGEGNSIGYVDVILWADHVDERDTRKLAERLMWLMRQDEACRLLLENLQ